MNNLVSTEWLEKNLDNVRLLDATWHMPATNRDAYSEFLKQHIKNANFFDLDKTSNQNSTLPHMLPSKNYWEKTISDFGIKNSDHIVIYFVSVLDGGLKKWIIENRETTQKISPTFKSNYSAKENKLMVLDKNQVNLNILNKNFQLIDARNKERFNGLQPEPRKELNSGHIKNSKNLPFTALINDLDNTFKSKKEIKKIFKNIDIEFNKDVAFTCGSGVTACILGLANSIISGKSPTIYDGSWSEYGLK